MPWHIESDRDDCTGFAVVQDDTGEVAGCHETREEADCDALQHSPLLTNLSMGALQTAATGLLLSSYLVCRWVATAILALAGGPAPS